MKIYINIIFLAFLLISCKKDKVEIAETNYGYNYFPLEAGIVNYYKITEIDIDKPLNKYDTVYYYLKTETDTPHYDLDNKLVTPINRYVRNNTNENWIIKDVWFAYRTDQHLVISEENVHYLKMIFPVRSDSKWNGNVYNTLSSQEYRVKSVDEAYNLNNISYDSALTVIEQSDSSLIHKYYKYESYVRGIGLIKLNNVQISSADNFTVYPVLPLEQRISKGTIYRQERINQ